VCRRQSGQKNFVVLCGARVERERGGKKEKWGAISKTRMFVG
jgi:hypothetical protein